MPCVPAGCSEQKWSKEIIHGTYYPHIDGVRTFAVLSVFLYHLFAPLCPGGFVGVDMFFVISGYLIAGGIIRQLKSDTFSLSSFYYRRVKRIMGAYFVMIAVVFLIGCLLYDSNMLEKLGRTITYSSLFSTNIYFLIHAGSYFGDGPEQNPLLNLWSLGVEEQFYLIIPLCLMLVWKRGRKFVAPVLIVLFLASLTGAIWKTEHLKFHSAFFWLHYRAWELLAGCLLAMLPVPGKAGSRAWVSLAGWAMVLYPFFFYSSYTSFPGVGAMPSVLGTGILIRYGSAGLSGRILKFPLTVGIGKISYSLYLWHWPVIVIWKYLSFGVLGWMDYGGIVIVSFALGFMSWKFIEVPVRLSQKFWTKKKAFGATALGCAALFLAGTAIVRTNGAHDYWHTAANGIVAPEHWKGPAFLPSHGITVPEGVAVDWWNLIRTPDPVLGDVCDYPLIRLGDEHAVPSYVLIGDSHALAISPGMDRISRDRGIAGVIYRVRFAPLVGIKDKDCLAHLLRIYSVFWGRNMDILLRWLKETPQLKTVYIDNRWGNLFVAGTNSGMRESMLKGMQNLCRALQDMGKDVVVIGPVPEWILDPVLVSKRNLVLGLAREPQSMGMDTEEQQVAMDFLNRLEKKGLCRIVWVHHALMQQGKEISEKNGVFWYMDDDHLSPAGAIHVAGAVADQLFPPAAASASGTAEGGQ